MAVYKEFYDYNTTTKYGKDGSVPSVKRDFESWFNKQSKNKAKQYFVCDGDKAKAKDPPTKRRNVDNVVCAEASNKRMKISKKVAPKAALKVPPKSASDDSDSDVPLLRSYKRKVRVEEDSDSEIEFD